MLDAFVSIHQVLNCKWILVASVLYSSLEPPSRYSHVKSDLYVIGERVPEL